MKKFALLLSTFFTASLLSTSAIAAPSPDESGPRPGTTQAVQCLIRQGPAGCGGMFEGDRRFAAKDWVFANPDRDFERGLWISSKFRRRASNSNGCDVMIVNNKPTREMDIFDVKFSHVWYILYVSPADADGKIRALAISRAPHEPWPLCGR
jgi:hypothetical protein